VRLWRSIAEILPPCVLDPSHAPCSASARSDTSAASTLTAIERRGSDTSDFTSDRRISLGWLAVEDALAASVSELTESDF
jgi:hypothetical protein